MSTIHYLLLSEVLLVKLQGVELDGEGAGVADHHLLLVPRAVGQDGAELQQRLAQLQPRLQTDARRHHGQALAALLDADGQAVRIQLLQTQGTL